MMFMGKAAIDYLAVEVNNEDSGESSHWRKCHSLARDFLRPMNR